MLTLCSRCREPFEAAKSWHHKCRPCWRTEQVNKDAQAIQDAYERGWHDGQQRGYITGRREERGSDNPDLAPLVDDLIASCHPDRHPVERASLATRATQELLAMRTRARNGSGS